MDTGKTSLCVTAVIVIETCHLCPQSAECPFYTSIGEDEAALHVNPVRFANLLWVSEIRRCHRARLVSVTKERVVCDL